MAAGTLVAIPLIIMVIIFQRRTISGLTVGGAKSQQPRHRCCRAQNMRPATSAFARLFAGYSSPR
jgi:hypothetical protein